MNQLLWQKYMHMQQVVQEAEDFFCRRGVMSEFLKLIDRK
jgi:hypothetical protein